MRIWSGSLFAAGLTGAWSFPWVAPLATLNRGLPDAELKALSRVIREYLRRDGGKFTAGLPAIAPLPFSPDDTPAFAFGPTLDITLPETFFDDAGLEPISPAVLGAALLQHPPPGNLPDPPQVSFRAAALAVARFRPLPPHRGHWDGHSLEWEIGKLHWLPK
ncbi:MAG: hypothetical protein FWB78_12690 [Treponema sp.]|nr:hypothetical protein [Treponema sp.]